MNYDIEKQLEALQKKYYLAIDEAFKAKTVLGEAIFEEMRQDLFDRYRIERDQLKEKAKIPDKNINFETKLKIDELTPHRRGLFWIFKNEARKLKEREVRAEDRIELDARTNDVEELEEKIYGTPEPPEEPKPANVAPPSEASTAAHGACDATHQNDEQTKKPAADVAEPPAAAPTSEEPKPKAKPKKVAKPTTKPPAPTAPAPQLSGQIAMDELDNK